MINDDRKDEFDVEITGEDNHDEPDIETIEEDTKDKIKQLREKLKTAESEKKQHLEDLQRAKADFLNTRKRLESAQAESTIRTENACLEKLLPLCDSFAMAMGNQEVWQSVDENWRTGVEGIHNQLLSILSQYQVEVVAPLGEEFNPQKHEAVGNVPATDECASGTIAEVVQAGYERIVGDTRIVLRPARVIVAD